MLTDVFSYRHADQVIWTAYTDVEQRLLQQCFQIVKDVLPCSYVVEGKKIEAGSAKWKYLSDQLCRELGVKDLSPPFYQFGGSTGAYSLEAIVANFISQPPRVGANPDSWIKERLNFVELALRLREDEIASEYAGLGTKLLKAKMQPAGGMRVPGDPVAGLRTVNAEINRVFASAVVELNERFRRAKAPLSYHNRFIQIVRDVLVEREVSKPFWALVADPLWINVDVDMKEALDLRDSGAKDPAYHAAKALESTVKVISDKRLWSTGKEKGAGAFINNLKVNGFLEGWEADMLQDYFSKLRNTGGHGPGSAPMLVLTPDQADWAIQGAMTWIVLLVRRF